MFTYLVPRSKYTVNPNYAPVADCFCVRFSPDDQYLATSFANGAIHVYSTETGGKCQGWLGLAKNYIYPP